MNTTFEIRQLVKTAKRNRLETIADTGIERTARFDYEAFCRSHPNDYFELVRIEHTENCLAHNGKPDHDSASC